MIMAGGVIQIWNWTSVCELSLNQWFTMEAILSLQGHLAMCLETLLIVMTGWVSTAGTRWVEARDAATSYEA